MRHRTVRITLAIAVVVTVALVGSALASAYDLHAAPDWAVGINELYEDGSFIRSIGNAQIGYFTVTGCIPDRLCGLD